MVKALVLAAAAAALLGAGPACGGEAPQPAVVTVLVDRPGGVPGRATGFVAADERVVTVAHVLDGGGAVAVRVQGGGERRARVVRVDRTADLALLEVPASEPRGVALASATSTASLSSGGREARVLGARDGSLRARRVEVRRRIVARVRDSAGPRVYTRRALVLAGDVAGGDSGAPVVDGDGRLVGVVFARSRREPGTAYAVDAGSVDRLLGR